MGGLLLDTSGIADCCAQPAAPRLSLCRPAHLRQSSRRVRKSIQACSHRTGQSSARQVKAQELPVVQRLSKDLLEAVHREDYAAAARIRDEIRQLEATDPLHQLQLRLQQAVLEERYQDAALLRDELEANTPVPPATESDTVTEGVRVQVKSSFMQPQSSIGVSSYVWAYKIKITNQGDKIVTLQSRHWVILHDDGHHEEVRGPGVVGEQPTLAPGQSFSYSSYCQLATPRGSMEGSFEFLEVSPATESPGRLFDVTIGKFVLDSHDAKPASF